MKPTVKQHYVTAAYLALFTSGGARHSPFFVHPIDGSPMREDIPDHVYFENHYHTLDFQGTAPDALEKMFAEYEGPLVVQLLRITSSFNRRRDRYGLVGGNPTTQAGTTELAAVTLEAALPQRREVVRGAIAACGLTNVVPALFIAPDDARLIVDTRLKKIWVHGVEIKGLVPDSQPYRLWLIRRERIKLSPSRPARMKASVLPSR